VAAVGLGGLSLFGVAAASGMDDLCHHGHFPWSHNGMLQAYDHAR